MADCEYQTLGLDTLSEHFQILAQTKSSVLLRHPFGRNTIRIALPFRLDEDAASLAGLMPDGSLIRDLRRIYFHQYKDPSKLLLFRDLIFKLFSPNNKVFIEYPEHDYRAYINSTTLARFFYHVLKIPKSNQQMRVPSWVFSSPDSVKYAYLREAFSMEGTILKKLYEIRFITKDRAFAESISRLLKTVHIDSYITERIGGTHRTLQYRVSIYRKENFEKFKNIGFSLPFHIGRFENALARYGISP